MHSPPDIVGETSASLMITFYGKICYTVTMYDLSFPNLGITIETLRNSIKFGNFSIAFYGLLIGLGIIIGLLLTVKEAKRTGQNPDDYYDFIIWGIIGGVVGARVFYVLFELDYYVQHPLEIFNLRNGGLAIYGTIIGAFTALFIWCKVKKKDPIRMLETMVPQLALAQAIGRWGNFFNMEAFGRYTEGLFAMQLRKAAVNPGMIDAETLQHVLTINGTEYIQVTPTFLYESIWCFLLFLFLLYMQRHQKFKGQLLCLYVGLYGLERMIVEGLRTDSLMLGSARISQVIAAVCFVGAIVVYIILYRRYKKELNEKKGTDPAETADS